VINKNQECIEFGRRVRTIRERQGISQEAFAEKADMHRTYIGGIERGERNPTLTMIFRIAKALNSKPERLVRTR
jgi:transcriptional regulator with XRE-family HTH domain